ncbi:MAG: FAD-dependent oxidoreductase [Patescibacteria group bacterium]|nr:FAD-dependent oxidoreductase [Patescibacteria group bacterium]
MTYSLAIIGGGPAGAAAAVYAARKRLHSIFITKDWLGQSYVSEGIENWIGTPKISGLDLSKSLETHAKEYAKGIIDFKEGELAARIEKSGDVFKITSTKGSYEARAILITSGSSRRKLDIPGAAEYENKGIIYCATCDGPLYADQDVAVIGGGNAGFESAAQLMAYCKSVTLLSRSEYKADPGTVEAVSKNPKVKLVQFAAPKEIKGDTFVRSLVYTDTKTKKDIELPVTGIFVEIGSFPNTDFVKGLVDLDQYNRIKVDAHNQRATIIGGGHGIWAAGDVTDGLFHQNNIAAGDAVKAVEDIYLWLHAK